MQQKSTNFRGYGWRAQSPKTPQIFGQGGGENSLSSNSNYCDVTIPSQKATVVAALKCVHHCEALGHVVFVQRQRQSSLFVYSSFSLCFCRFTAAFSTWATGGPLPREQQFVNLKIGCGRCTKTSICFFKSESHFLNFKAMIFFNLPSLLVR